MPLGEEMTGMRSRCAKLGQLRAGLRQRHAVADEQHRPLRPRASCRARRDTSSGEAPLRCALWRGAAGGTSTSSSSWNTLKGTSTLTGPGRPDSIVVIACRKASGSMSTRVGWKLRFTTGRMMLGKSAWKCRLISWNGLRLNCWVGTLAVIASSAEESDSATAAA